MNERAIGATEELTYVVLVGCVVVGGGRGGGGGCGGRPGADSCTALTLGRAESRTRHVRGESGEGGERQAGTHIAYSVPTPNLANKQRNIQPLFSWKSLILGLGALCQRRLFIIYRRRAVFVYYSETSKN